MLQEERKNDFTTGSIPVKLFKFMFPILGALILQAMYGAVDLLIVGKFGSDAGISAVSTGSSIIQFVTFLISGLTMGLTVMIGQYLGRQEKKRIGPAIGCAISFFLVITAVITVSLLAFAPVFSNLLRAPEEAFELTNTYVRICGGGFVFVVAYNVISGIFRGMGNSKFPLIFVAIACVVNIMGDLLFVAVLNMDVAGAATATILAQAVSVILSFVIIRKQKNIPFKLRIKDIRFNKDLKTILKIGSPIAFQDVLTNMSFLILFSIINNMGLAASSGYGVAQKITSFVMLIPSALMQSMSAFIAQNVGAGKEKRAQKALFCGMGMGVIIGVFTSLLIFFKGDLIASVFTTDRDYIVKAAEYLKGFSPEPIITCIAFGFIGYFNGHGKTLFVMVQGMLQTFLIRVPFSYLFSLRENCTLTEIGIAVPMATTFGIIVCVSYFLYFRKNLDYSGENE